MDPKNRQRNPLEDLFFSTLERLASGADLLKDPQAKVGGAFEWAKGFREVAQEKLKDEISQRISKLDFNILAKKLGDHLAKNYRLKVEASIQWEPLARVENFDVKLTSDEVERAPSGQEKTEPEV